MTRYSKGAIILHWLMALMIIGNLAGGFLHDFVFGYFTALHFTI